MINLSELLYDPDFCQEFTIHRFTGEWVEGGKFVPIETLITVTGIVTPQQSTEIIQTPEGDRSTGMVDFYCEIELYATSRGGSESQISDQAEWNNMLYRLFNILPFSDYGFYKASGVYIGNTSVTE